MDWLATPIPDLHRLRFARHGDERGSFYRLYGSEELAPLLGERRLAQVNHSFTSRAGTVRGMHYQTPPAAEVKLVRCLKGRVFDVAVDLRAGSATRGQWFGLELSDDQDEALLIPEGFAHGFQALTDDVALLYCHTAPYSPAHEAGVHHADPALGIAWPLPVTVLSDRDQALPPYAEGPAGVI